jgi:hypothetical protein
MLQWCSGALRSGFLGIAWVLAARAQSVAGRRHRHRHSPPLLTRAVAFTLSLCTFAGSSISRLVTRLLSAFRLSSSQYRAPYTIAISMSLGTLLRLCCYGWTTSLAVLDNCRGSRTHPGPLGGSWFFAFAGKICRQCRSHVIADWELAIIDHPLSSLRVHCRHCTMCKRPWPVLSQGLCGLYSDAR